MKNLFANNASTRTDYDVLAIHTSVTLPDGHGASFPQPVGDGSDGFPITIEDRRFRQMEICLCTQRSGDVLILTRAQEGTIALDFKAGATVSLRLTARVMDDFWTAIDQAEAYKKSEADARFVNVEGDTMAGNLVVPMPLNPSHAVPKQYIDENAAPLHHTHPQTDVVNLVPDLAAKEPALPPGGTISDFLRGDKTWASPFQSFDQTATVFMSDLPPSPAKPGALWFESDTGIIYLNYRDSDSSQWLSLLGVPGPEGPPGETGAGLEDGDKGDIVVSGGVWTFDTSVVTPFARSFLDDTDAGAVRTTLGVPATVHTHAQGDVTNLVSDLAAKAPIASPAFTGTPVAPTPVSSANSTEIATTAFVKVQGYVTAAHGHPQTDIANLVADLAAKAPLASPSFTGVPLAPTPAPTANNTQIPTTAWVKSTLTGYVADTGSTNIAYARKNNGWVQSTVVGAAHARATHWYSTGGSQITPVSIVYTIKQTGSHIRIRGSLQCFCTSSVHLNAYIFVQFAQAVYAVQSFPGAAINGYFIVPISYDWAHPYGPAAVVQVDLRVSTSGPTVYFNGNNSSGPLGSETTLELTEYMP